MGCGSGYVGVQEFDFEFSYHFGATVDVSMLTEVQSMEWEVEELVRAEKSLPTVDGVDEVMVPGDPQQRTFEQRSAEGIPMPPVATQP